jgi:pyridoxine 5-phosphate synthase
VTLGLDIVFGYTGEVSIGHALIADALELGYSATIRAYLGCIHAAGATA